MYSKNVRLVMGKLWVNYLPILDRPIVSPLFCANSLNESYPVWPNSVG